MSQPNYNLNNENQKVGGNSIVTWGFLANLLNMVQWLWDNWGGGGSPGGVTNSIQTNNGSGGFGGDGNLLYDGSSITMNGGAGGISIKDLYNNAINSDNGDGLYMNSQYNDYFYLDEGIYMESSLGAYVQILDEITMTDAYNNEIVTNSSGGIIGNTSAGYYQWGNSASPFSSLTDTANTVSMSTTGGIVLNDGTDGTGVGSSGQVWTSNGINGSWATPSASTYRINPQAATYTLTIGDFNGITVVTLNSGGGSVIATLPNPSTITIGVPCIVKGIAIGVPKSLTITRFGSEEIDGIAADVVIASTGSAPIPMVKIITPDNVNWLIIP